MNSETRKKLTKGTQVDLTSGNACWETPPLVFDKLNADFGPFNIDICADASRHHCPVWFGPDSPIGETDALLADWLKYGSNGFNNPPYGRFIQRILATARGWSRLGFTSTHLLPMRVTKAFKDHVLVGASDLLFCDSRLCFFENGVPRLNDKAWREKGKALADPAVFDSIIVRYRPGITNLNVDVWNVPKHVTPDDLSRARLKRQITDLRAA